MHKRIIQDTCQKKLQETATQDPAEIDQRLASKEPNTHTEMFLHFASEKILMQTEIVMLDMVMSYIRLENINQVEYDPIHLDGIRRSFRIFYSNWNIHQ